MRHRRHKFEDGQLGDALDRLFASGDGLDLETNGRIAIICRLLERMPGGDSVHEMVHGELDYLESNDGLGDAIAAVRASLMRRRYPRDVFGVKG